MLLSPATPEPRPKLGEILVGLGVVTSRQLDHGLAAQRERGLPLGRMLLELNHLTDEALHQALARQAGVPYVDLETVALDRALARAISERYARRHNLLPIALAGRTLTVACDDPTARTTLDELRRLTGFEIAVVTASSRDIQRASRRLYRGSGEAIEVLGVAGAEVGTHRADHLFREILRQALESRCSDVHLEMVQAGVAVRFRIDGVLRQPALGPLQEALDTNGREIVSRVKVLAALDIAERRRPQDGSFQVNVDRGGSRATVDLRVSVVPSYAGESVVIRILDRLRAPQSLADLDLSPTVSARLEAVFRRTTGIFLVTGPTGSGKSTTLYACLMRLHRPEVRILTAEDPVEYVYEGLSQSEVDAGIGNTFAAYLRAFLRHDPEIIMVGEIRDEETAAMAFRAAQTGHLLLSTLHTSTAVAALPRLRDLHVDASLVASSLIGVLSQRLVRRICSDCREPHAPPEPVVAALFGSRPAGLSFQRGAGCPACGYSGFQGRMLLAELWMPDDEDLLRIMRGAPFDEIRRSAERTTTTMAADARERLRRGETTPEEILRVLGSEVGLWKTPPTL
jgi:type IV pilus assembly protein PilB